LFWTVEEGEVKVDQIKGPLYLPVVQLPHGHQILQVLVVCPDLYWMSGAFQEVSPVIDRQ